MKALLFLLVALPSLALAQSRARPVMHPPFNTAVTTIFMRCDSPRVIDGDTVGCASGYRLRLLGIQAPELKCRKGQDCVRGDAVAARDSLVLGIAQGALSWQYIRRDGYSRPVVIARAGTINLSCWQLRRTDAVLKYDHRRRIERECGVKRQARRPARRS